MDDINVFCSQVKDRLAAISKRRGLRVLVPVNPSVADIFCTALLNMVFPGENRVASSDSMTVMYHPTDSPDAAFGFGLDYSSLRFLGILKRTQSDRTGFDLLSKNFLADNQYMSPKFQSLVDDIRVIENKLGTPRNKELIPFSSIRWKNRSEYSKREQLNLYVSMAEVTIKEALA